MEKGDYEKKSGQIRQLASLSPEALTDHLSQTHPSIAEVAPNVTPHIHAAANNAIQFLNSRLPNAGGELLQDKAPKVSEAQKRAWLDLHDTVSDPISVLDRVKNNTISRHHIEALQTVYPDLHQEMIEKVQEHLGRLKVEGKQIPYAKRVSISKFLGSALDSTLTPQAMQAVIRSAGQNTGPQAQANQKKASGVELNQINKVNRIYATPSQDRILDKKA